jgi:hypothetical protein
MWANGRDAWAQAFEIPLLFVALAVRPGQRTGHQARRNYLGLTILAVATTIVVACSPTPAQDRPEMQLLEARRSDYEHLVQLARQDQLPHSEKCSGFSFSPPEGYEALARECIVVGTYNWFSVSFAPQDARHQIVYMDDPSKVKFHSACETQDGVILRQFDANWFLCRDDRN